MTRVVTTTATGRREARPDAGAIEIRVTGDGDAAADARDAARTRAATVRESVIEAGASDDRIRTVEFRVTDSSQQFEPDTDAAYLAVERLRVDCAPEAAADVAVAATDADADATVPSVRFELREPARRRLQKDALAAAMEQARAKAERLAAVEGLTVGRVRDVTTVDADTGTDMSSIVDDALAAGSDVDLHPDPIVLSETVEVSYELLEE